MFARRGVGNSNTNAAALDRILSKIGFDVAAAATGSSSLHSVLGTSANSPPLTSSLALGNEALKTVLNSKINREAFDLQNERPSSPFMNVQSLRRVFAHRTEAALQITVPRDFVNSLDGFVPFFLATARHHSAQMKAADIAHTNRLRGGVSGVNGEESRNPLGDESVLVEKLLDWVELFFPEKDSTSLPLPTLLAAVDAFFVYQKGGIDTGIPFGLIRPYFGQDMPIEDSELKLYRVLYHWLEEHSGGPGKMFQTAIDCGTKSGYLSALMIKANMQSVIAVDDNEFGLQCLEDNLKRLKHRGAIKKRALFTLRNSDLLPSSQSFGSGDQPSSATRSEPFASAATRRRQAGRLPLMNIAGVEDTLLETQAARNSMSLAPSSVDLITHHQPTPWLFDHPMQSRHASGDSQISKILSLLETSSAHEGLLKEAGGHVAFLTSNFHELLNLKSLGDLDTTGSFAATIAGRSDKLFATLSSTTSTSRVPRIQGWEIVKRETRSLTNLGTRYLGGGGNGGGMFKALIPDKDLGYASYLETKRFYDALQHEMVVIRPRFSKFYSGNLSAGEAANDFSHKVKRAAVDPFASNKHIDWEDTFEYNHYMPKDGSGNPFHFTSIGPSFSYLADEVYGEGSVGALEAGSGDAKFYNSSDPADSLGRLPRGSVMDEQRAAEQGRQGRRGFSYNKEGEASANDRFVKDGSSLAGRRDLNKKTGTTPMFDLVFNREMRLKRQNKYRKLAFDSGQRERFYLDKKVVESQAAKLQLMNEVNRFDFRGPKY